MTAPQTRPGLSVVRVDHVDPLVLACAECGWTPAGCQPSATLLTAVVDHWAGAHQGTGGARLPVLRVEREDPLVVSCARCGGVTQLCAGEDLLPWRVIEHWAAVHRDRAGPDEDDSR